MKRGLLALLIIFISGVAGNCNAISEKINAKLIAVNEADGIIDASDTIVFDLSKVSCSGSYLQIPVSVLSDDTVYAVDFSLKFDLTKITFDSVVNYKTYLTAAANYNTNDSILRFTSYSLLPIEHDTPIVSLRFNLFSGQLSLSDLNTISPLLNGNVCSFKLIDPLPAPIISASDTAIYLTGDSVSLSATAGVGYTYLWSTGATDQSINVNAAGTYFVTVTNMGGCNSTAAINILANVQLPVELTNFYVEENNEGILVAWSTASEVNNNYFTVERSMDGKNWNEVKRVVGSGNSNTPRNYTVTDRNPLMGMNYYRLRQTDYDGNYTLSEIKMQYFSIHEQPASKLNLYPNPAQDHTVYFNLTDSRKQSGQVKIFNLQGLEVYAHSFQTQDLSNGKLAFQINLDPNLPAGSYLFVYSGDSFREIQKLILQ